MASTGSSSSVAEEVTQGTSMTTREELADDDIQDQDDDGSSCYQEDIANPTRDTLAEGIIGLLRPSLEILDVSVVNTRKAQKELKDQITGLEDQLRIIEEEQGCPIDLEMYINKLNSAKKRVIVVNNILQGAQDRLNRVHQNCLKETAKRRNMLEPSPATTPSAASGDPFTAKLQP